MGVVKFIRGRLVHSESLGSLEFALGFVRFIRGRWVQAGAPWVSPWVSGFTRVRPRGLQVHSWSLGSRGCVMGGVGIIRGRWVHSEFTLVLPGVVGVRLVHTGAPWGSSGVGEFSRLCPGSRRVHLGSFGSRGCTVGSSGSFGIVWFARVRPGGRRVHSGCGVFGLTRVRPRCRRVHWGSLSRVRPRFLFGSRGCTVGVVWFIRGRLVHAVAP